MKIILSYFAIILRTLVFVIIFVLVVPGHHIKAQGYSRSGGYNNPPDTFGGPQKGQIAPNAILKTLDGKTVNLSEYIGKRPLVLIFGSLTCPIFRSKHSSMETFYAKYDSKAAFLLIYTVEAHPKGDICPYSGREWVTDINEQSGILYRQPVNEEERIELANKARSNLNIKVPVLIDNMDNNAWQAYGKAPNCAYLIGADGLIKLRQGWFEPGEFEQVLLRELNIKTSY